MPQEVITLGAYHSRSCYHSPLLNCPDDHCISSSPLDSKSVSEHQLCKIHAPRGITCKEGPLHNPTARGRAGKERFDLEITKCGLKSRSPPRDSLPTRQESLRNPSTTGNPGTDMKKGVGLASPSIEHACHLFLASAQFAGVLTPFNLFVCSSLGTHHLLPSLFFFFWTYCDIF